jgi:hypothetical protein
MTCTPTSATSAALTYQYSEATSNLKGQMVTNANNDFTNLTKVKLCYI